MPESLHLLDGCAVHRPAAATWQEVLDRLAQDALAAGHVRPSFPAALLERERRYPTGLPTEVPSAIPHTDPEHVLRPGVAVAALAAPVPFGQMGTPGTTVPVRLVVLLCLTDAGAQVGALQALLARLRDTPAVQALLAQDRPGDFADAVRDWLGASRPPSHVSSAPAPAADHTTAP